MLEGLWAPAIQRESALSGVKIRLPAWIVYEISYVRLRVVVVVVNGRDSSKFSTRFTLCGNKCRFILYASPQSLRKNSLIVNLVYEGNLKKMFANCA